VNRKPTFGRAPEKKDQNGGSGWLSKVSWGVAFLMVLLMVYVLLRRTPIASFAQIGTESAPAAVVPTFEPVKASLPEYKPGDSLHTLARQAEGHTVISDRPRQNAVRYTVEKGDSVFSIAKDYNLKPESVLWANYDVLKDDPQLLEVGLTLNIPPVDGVYYKWRDGDSVQGVAGKYQVDPESIISYPGNHLDMSDPKISKDTFVMIPGGKGEFRQWVVPTIPRGPAGVSTGFDTCDTSNSTAYGTGSFVWPAPVHQLSGNDYWGGHLGIDIAAGTGQYIYASDSGVVVYAGAIGGGYGLMVMIDHGNGYQTLYAHNSQVNVRCGQGVSQGQVIALAGSTGNSTGPHLHFELRSDTYGRVSPWDFLK